MDGAIINEYDNFPPLFLHVIVEGFKPFVSQSSSHPRFSVVSIRYQQRFDVLKAPRFSEFTYK
jgi:hypothetical protein